jgi:DNA-binding NarL/FixJ family response regulator
MAVLNLGHVALQQEDPARALAAFGESLAVCHELNYHEGIPLALAGCAGALRLYGEMTAATRLLAAATAYRDAIGAVFDATDQAAYDRDLAAVRAYLDDAVFQAAWRAGQELSCEQAVVEAQGRVVAATQHDSVPAPHFPANLTAREVEVLQLLAHGLTTAEIAKRLVISPRTVNTHLHTIYRKLHVTSRSAATRFAVQHGLM